MSKLFREFDKADWETFSGCESQAPKINDFTRDDLAVIIDGRTVQVLFDGLCYSKEFESNLLANDIASVCVSSPETMSPRRFEILLDESIGGY